MKEAKDYNPSKDPRLINCKTECGNDKCYARRYGLFAEKTCPNFVEPKPITNADRIRAMTDEELAEFMAQQRFCTINSIADRLEIDTTMMFIKCQDIMLDWLKKEAENGKN